MSLQVWLPLNGNLLNKGLADVNVTNNGATINNSGKIGKCYSFNGTNNYITIPVNVIKNLTKDFSFCFWVKFLSFNTSYQTVFSATASNASWANEIICFQRNASTNYFLFTVANGSSYTATTLQTGTLAINTWYHFVCTYLTAGRISIYQNGNLISSHTISFTPGVDKIQNFNLGRSHTGYYSNMLLNDFRIYNYALSKKEVKEIAKGLVLHYPLDDNFIQTLNNCYTYPTFQTTSSSGGWSHWGATGHVGTYGQNTNTNYIFKTGQLYSHWVANGASATKPYLLYQSPAFAGGIRSLQCICKEENSLEIDESIICPDWNARNGGVPYYKWTSITPLGNGFYHCKCEGIQQDGSNDLIGFDIKPGYKVYISEAYVENNKSVCSDIFFSSSNIVYDCSGYLNNGIANNIICSIDSPKYQISSLFMATNTSYIKVSLNNWMAQYIKKMTINLWAYSENWASQSKLFSCTESGGFNTLTGNSGYLRFPIHVCTNLAQTSYAYQYDSKEIKVSDLSAGWHMFTFIYDAEVGTKTYIDAQLHHTYNKVSYGIHFNTNARLFLGCEANTANPYQPYFTGKQSDFRLYYTTLNDEDILLLYHISVIADRNNNFYTLGNFNLIENNTPYILKTAITNIYKLNEIVKDNLLLNTSIEKTGNSANAQWFRWNVETPYLSSNTSYTLSFDAKITNTSDVFYIGFANNDSTQEIIAQEVTVTTDYKRYTFTKATTKTNINSIIISNARQYNRGNENNTGSVLYIKNIKLELGDYNTPYILAGNNISNIYYTRNGLLIDNQSMEI